MSPVAGVGAPRLVFRCPYCEVRQAAPVGTAAREHRCGGCGRAVRLAGDPRLGTGEAPAACPLCGCGGFYRQKDFNRYLGIGLVVGAGVLDALLDTLPLCLVGTSALDLALFRFLPWVLVCYGCEGILRGVPGGSGGAFDLERAERERNEAVRRFWEMRRAAGMVAQGVGPGAGRASM